MTETFNASREPTAGERRAVRDCCSIPLRLAFGSLIIAAALGACSTGAEQSNPRRRARPTETDDGTRGLDLIALGEQLSAKGQCEQPNPGRSPLRRISREEYGNAVFELFGRDAAEAQKGLVEDEKVVGFNSNSVALVSSLAQEQYLASAEATADHVVKNLSSVTGCTDLVDQPCVKAFLQERARRAFRGGLPEEELTQLFSRYETVSSSLGTEAALRFGVEALLLSSRFLYVIEFGQGQGDVVQLTGQELAARLAASIWRSVPDTALLDAADAGELQNAEQVMAQARRMLSDVRADAMLKDFSRQWLNVERVPSVTRDNMVWKDFTSELARDMLTETELFFTSVVRGTGSFAELFTANYTVANTRLSAFYELSGPTGGAFERVNLGPERSGILTHGSFLTAYSHFNRPSVVFRGKTVRTNMLCDVISPPPNNVDTTVQPLKDGESERDATEAHLKDSGCKSCHTLMDPIGHGFEQFDAVGKFIGERGGTGAGEIVATGAVDDTLAGAFQGVRGLAEKIAGSEITQQCYAIQALRYSLGREEVSNDACGAFDIWQAFSDNGLNLVELIVAITGTDTFRYRTAVKPGEACE